MGGSILLSDIGLFISIFYGIIVYDDDITIASSFAMLCMVGVVILCTPMHRTKTTGNKNNTRWFMFALTSGIMNGIASSIKRTVSAQSQSINMKTFLFWGFLFSICFLMILLPFFHVSSKDIKTLVKKRERKIIICGITAGLGTVGGNLFQMMALNKLSSVIVYPATVGILVVALWIISLFWYKEVKLHWKNTLAIILCILGVILNNL